jgi:plasmid stabilization system protein ParE
MARRLIWTIRARNDLFELLDWIDRDAPVYARGVSLQFERRGETLPDQPGQGRRVPEYEGDLELREVFVHRWRMIYQVTDGSIEIIAIIHGARLLENAVTLE